MIVIAVLLIVAIVALTIGVFLAETEAASFEVLEESFSVDGGALFVAGLVTGLGLVGTLWMLRVGVRRATLRRREVDELRSAHRRQQAALEQERAALEAEKDELRRRPLVRPYVGSAERPTEQNEGLGEPARPSPPAEPSSPLERRPPFGSPGQRSQSAGRGPTPGPIR